MIESLLNNQDMFDEIERTKWRNIIRILLNCFKLPTDLLFVAKDSHDEVLMKYTVEFLKSSLEKQSWDQIKITRDLDDIKKEITQLFDNNLLLKENFLRLLKKNNLLPQILTKLDIYLSNSLNPRDPHKFLYDNDLFYFPEKENYIIQEVERILTGKLNNRVLISGIPESGKSILGYKIGIDLLQKDYSVYHFRFDNLRNPDLLWQDLFLLRNERNVLVIADNCHTNIPEAAHICQDYDKFNNISFLFLSRITSHDDNYISEYDDISFKDYFTNSSFYLTSDSFEDKAIGIIHKFKTYYESKYSQVFEIGNPKFVINNSHKNLVTLFYNLEFWDADIKLDKLNKEEIFNKLFKKYLSDKRFEKLLLISALYKYEIYFEAKENETAEMDDLLNNGIIRQHPNSSYFFLYHSSFAKLLLNAFTIHTSFKRYKSLDEFVFSKIEGYLLSFKDYPLNLENLFHNLITNHGQLIAIRLLQEQKIFEMFVNYFNNCRYSLNLLFILYRIQQYNYNLAKELFNKIPISTWVNNFRSLSLASLSVALIKLNKTESEKAAEIIKNFSIDELTESARKTKFNLLANSLRELDKLTGQSIIGRKIYFRLNDEELIPKIEESSLAHIGKSLSELFYVDQKKTTELFKKIDKKLVAKKISESDIKYISKALSEFSKIDPKYSSVIYQSMDNELLISKLYETSAEGLGRSLNEFNSINIEKTKNLFERIGPDHIINLLSISTIEQVAHSLSEMFLVNEEKTLKIFYAVDTQTYLHKIHNINTTLQKLGNALKNFRKIDEQKIKLKEIINSINPNIFSKRANSIDFNKLCISLSDISMINRELALNIFKGIPKRDILVKAQDEKLQNIGRSLSKITSFDKDLAKRISSSIDWHKILLKSKNISLAQISNSLSDLNTSDKHLAKNIYNTLEIEFLTKLATKSETSSLRQSLRKLRNVDEHRTKKIFENLKIELSKT